MVVVDENDNFRRGIVACLDTDTGVRVVYDAPAGPVLVPVDVTVSSQRATLRLTDCGPVVVCSDDHVAEHRFGAIEVIAVLPRDRLTGEQLVAAVRAAASGLRVNIGPSSPRDGLRGVPERSIEILRLLAAGYSTHRATRPSRPRGKVMPPATLSARP